MSWNSPRQVVFPSWFDTAIKVVVALALAGGGYVSLLVAYGFSPRTLDVGYAPEQPVPYSHALHVGELGLDCRYCHTGVERNGYANIPTAQTCMNCHAKAATQSPLLEPVREAFRTGLPIQWKKIHDLPNYVYFDHSAHVNRGVGCEECHGRIDTMAVVRQVQPLSMSWCVDCHRHPDSRLRPPALVTQMGFDHTKEPGGKGKSRAEYGRMVGGRTDPQHKLINPPTDCSTCHR
ncbi:MAG: cytochrome c3 family protein [Planctomycetota bacterium]